MRTVAPTATANPGQALSTKPLWRKEQRGIRFPHIDPPAGPAPLNAANDSKKCFVTGAPEGALAQ